MKVASEEQIAEVSNRMGTTIDILWKTGSLGSGENFFTVSTQTGHSVHLRWRP